MIAGSKAHPRQLTPLREGVELDAPNGRRYRLLAYLGGGRTAEVWKATPVGEPDVEVAVKIMAPGLDEDARKQFLREVEILFAASRAEEELGLRLDEFSLIPKVEAIADEQDPPFFVETLASGKPLDEIIREGVQLPEQEVLAIGEQLCRVFQVLHEKLHRSYLDFQPRNVFWDEGTKRITVVDWNLLSPEGRADVPGDLETLGRLLYRLAVGEAPALNRLDTAERWKLLTSGTKAILIRALHISPPRRYAGAAETRKELQQQLSWWHDTSGNLLRQVAQLLESAKTLEPPENETASRQAQHILDVAERKGAEAYAVEKLREEIITGLAGSGALGRGQAFFAASDYLVGRDLFEEARLEAMTLVEKLAAWRWFLAADAGVQGRGHLTPHRDTVTRAVKVLCDWTTKEWEGIILPGGADTEAIEPVQVAHISNLQPLQLLANELKAWTSLLRAREPAADDAAAYQARADGYRKAVKLAETLPYGELLTVLWGDLAGLADSIEAHAEELKRRQALLESLEREFTQNARSGIEKLCQALGQNPGDWDLTQLAMRWSQTLIQQGDLEATRQFLSGAMTNVNPRCLGEVLNLRQEISRQLRWLHELDWAEREVGALLAVGETSTFLPALSADQLANEATELLAQVEGLERHQRAEALARWIHQRLGEEHLEKRWQKVVGILEQIAGDLAEERSHHLRRRAWELALRAIRAESLPSWYESSLMQVTTSLAPSEEARKALRERWEERGEALRQGEKKRQLCQVVEIHCQAAERLATLEPSPKFVKALQELEEAAALSRELGDPTLVEKVEAKRREYLAAQDSFNEQQLREQIQTHQRAAQKMASLEPSPKLDEALEELGQAIDVAKQLGDQGLVKQLETQQREYETTRRALDERLLLESIEAHRQAAQELVDTGLISRLPLALRELDEAIRLSGELGDDRCLQTFKSQRSKFEAHLRAAKDIVNGVEFLAQQQRWGEAINLIKELRDDYGITGRDVRGQIDQWLQDLTFEYWARQFERASRDWSRGTSKQHRATILKDLDQALKGLKSQPLPLGGEQQKRLERMEETCLQMTVEHWAWEFDRAAREWDSVIMRWRRTEILKELEQALQGLQPKRSLLGEKQRSKLDWMEKVYRKLSLSVS